MTAGPLSALTFHHLGLAVKDDSAALRMYGALGYDIGERVNDPLQNVYVRLCTAPGRPTVEIVQPGEAGRSPVDGIISKYNEMIYHTCYETVDLAQALQALGALDLRPLALGPRRPAVLFNGRHVSFYRIQGVGVIELLELS